ncbi:spore germination protein [Anaerosporobacter faecicola]|uniref:spore germination protein n=1 Tax=Anaerosporobacter faecicola TaxID=2718714 RepID=UPI00143A0F6D|nr:spore germination protein [Anaerosporobacter faecicola]
MPQLIESKYLSDLFAKSGDVLVREIKTATYQVPVHIFCVDGLVNDTIFDQTILRPFAENATIRESKNQQEVMEAMLSGMAYHDFATKVTDMSVLIQGVMSGMAGVIFDDLHVAILFDARGFDKRSIAEPSDEGVVKGAKDCFIEVLRTNTAMIRRRIRSRYLVIEQMTVGRVNRADIAIAYLSNIADLENVERLKKAINKIDIDNTPTPAFIEEFIVQNRSSIFPQIMYTQRPDRCSSNLTDGRIALIIDGMPFVYILPCQLPMLMQSPEDYAENCIVGSCLRTIRYFALILTLLLPGLYIAITTFQQEMLPVELALSLQNAKQNVPFSSAVEVFGLLLSFEIIIEAGLRLPKTVGQAMSIVGGLVVGQAAVAANLISPGVVIVIAFTGIAGFTLPNQDLANAVRVLRFLIAIVATFTGFLGIMFSVAVLILHLCSLDNYGVAYLSPFVAAESKSHKDTLFRYPVRFFKYRPEGIAKKNHRKQK